MDLLKLIAKFIAIQKGNHVQKTDLEAHALIVKWNKFQLMYKSSIELFFPRNGDHPDVIMKVLTTWNPKAKEMLLDMRSHPAPFLGLPPGTRNFPKSYEARG